MKSKLKWKRGDNGVWFLFGNTTFSVSRDKIDGRWDICEGDGYLCTTRYVGTAKRICERLALSPAK